MRIGTLVVAIFLALWPQPASATQRCATPELVDNLLWERYDKTPKIDRSGIFEWKDRIAAQMLKMTIKEYVIGGMREDFRRKVCLMFEAMLTAGLKPGITSGFRDDWRQDVAEGRKGRTGHSFHGGSRRGGYGHGSAVDVVSLGDTRAEQLANNARLWRWIDQEGRAYGLGRPYGNWDAPHIAQKGGPEFGRKLARVAKAAKARLAKWLKKKAKKLRYARNR